MSKPAFQFQVSLTVDHLILLNIFHKNGQKKVIDGYLKEQTNQLSIKKNLAMLKSMCYSERKVNKRNPV